MGELHKIERKIIRLKKHIDEQMNEITKRMERIRMIIKYNSHNKIVKPNFCKFCGGDLR